MPFRDPFTNEWREFKLQTCKACGKAFIPKSGSQRLCYDPCDRQPCDWEGCETLARVRRRFCTKHAFQMRKKTAVRKPCVVEECKNDAGINTPLCSKHLRRKAEHGDPLVRVCRSCHIRVKLEEDTTTGVGADGRATGGAFLCDACLVAARVCAEPSCGWKANLNSVWCNRHWRRKTKGPWRKKDRREP